MEEVHEVREARSAAELAVAVGFVAAIVVAVVLPESESDREEEEVAVVVMEGRVELAWACTGDSLDEMGEGGRWWMVGRPWPLGWAWS